MESKKEIVACESAPTVGSKLRDLLSRQDLQPRLVSHGIDGVSGERSERAFPMAASETEIKCMFSVP